METNDHIISLIVKKLNGLADKDELEQLNLWISSDISNQAEYDVFVKLWEESIPGTGMPVFDTQTAWGKMDAAMSATHTAVEKSKPRAIPLIYKLISVAAAVILMVSYGWYIWDAKYRTLESFAADKNQTVLLPDGSIVLLRKGATITYHARFESNSRNVKLSGEAFFQVKRKETQPFRIFTGNAEVTVLGTSFIIRSTDSKDEVIVTSGKVTVTDKEKRADPVFLTAGQKVILENNHFRQTALTDSNYLAWKTGVMDFKNAPLSKVLEDVGNYYGLPVYISGDKKERAEKINITVHFQNQPLDQVLEELKLITGLELKKEGNTIKFYEKLE